MMEIVSLSKKKTLHLRSYLVIKSIGNSTLNVVGESLALFF
ncbi:hypothetical protein AA0X95_01270 [Bacillus sp. 1P10SD]